MTDSTDPTIRHVHFTAVCGVGMAPVATLFKRAGYHVTGSDAAAFPPMSEVLRSAGIEILDGFSAAHLDPSPDLVIVGNAVPKTNPEAESVMANDIPHTSFPAAVGEYFIRDRTSLVVAGTHGKTTTTGMLACVLETAGLDPGYLVGGLVRDLGEFARDGQGRFFVIEGDEYDTAFFDKRPKFVHYRPGGAIITSVEFDHADIYRDLDHVKESFTTLVGLLSDDAPLIWCHDYPALVDVVTTRAPKRASSYGLADDSDWGLKDVAVGEAGIQFKVTYRGRVEDEINLALIGRMNALNALAVYAITREFNVDTCAVREALAKYRGAARRQEIIGQVGGVTIIEDFAHHPTAVFETLSAVREHFGKRRIVAVFEPRSNTSRRRVFQERYTEALAVADRVVLSAVYAKPNDPLSVDEILSTDRLIADLEGRGRQGETQAGPDEILESLVALVRDGDVVVTMSNGAFGNLPRRLLARLRG